MKKRYTLSFLFISLFGLLVAQPTNTLVIGGVTFNIDTVASMKVGPGTHYSALRYTTSSKGLSVFMLEVDATNPHIKFESVLGKDSIVTCERTSDMAIRKSREGAVYFAGTNADFFSTSGSVGIPVHGCVVEGQIARIPASSPLMAFSGSSPILSNIAFKNSYCKTGDQSLTINNVNTARGENQLILYNTLNGNYTHTNIHGKEVLIELDGSTEWTVNRALKAKVVSVESGKGNMRILPNHAVLSGHGTAVSFLDPLKAGDEVELFLGFDFPNLSSKPTVRAMVGGDRMILQDGVVTDNDWAELHPRTAIGYSQNGNKVYFCVVDGRSSISAGVRTKELADIIKSAGAYTAVNLDGGGSSAMYVKEFGVMNSPSDGVERAVSNGIYTVNTAPADDNIAEIKCSTHSVSLPKYGVYEPLFFGYNQYGTLIDTEVKGVKLSCSQEMGYIDEQERFIASGTQGGILYADYNGLKTEIRVNLTTDATPSLKLEEAIVDKDHPYSIEVLALSAGKLRPLLPEALSWTIDNPEVCTIERGVLTGLANGSTLVHGTLGTNTVTLKVNVEIPAKAIMPITDIENFSWELSKTSNISGASVTSSELPLGIKYLFTGGRNPYVQLANDIPLYSIPSSLSVVINTGKAALLNASIGAKAKTDKNYTTFQFTGIPVGEDYTFTLDMEKVLTDTSVRGAYPIYINGLKFTLDTSKHPTNEECEITVKEFNMVYEKMVVGISNPALLSKLRVYPNPVKEGEAFIALGVESAQDVRMELYAYDGTLVDVQTAAVSASNEVRLSLEGLPAGYYFVKVSLDGKVETVKICIN